MVRNICKALLSMTLATLEEGGVCHCSQGLQCYRGSGFLSRMNSFSCFLIILTVF